MAKRRCRATAKGTGERCLKRGNNVCAKCRVCYSHGCNCGNPGGAPRGNTNGAKHGIWTKVLTDEEKELWSEIEVAALDEEVRLATIQLRRAFVLQREVDAQRKAMGKLRLRRRERGPDGTRSVYELPDYHAQIDRALLRVESLKARRAQIGGADSSSVAETARKIREALAEMEAASSGEEPEA